MFYLYMYIGIWCLCRPCHDFLDRGLMLTRKLLNQGFILVNLKSSLRKFYGRHHDCWPLRNICVTNDHGYVRLVVNTSRSFLHSWRITEFVTRVTRGMSIVEHEQLTLPGHLNSPPVFRRVRVARSFVFCLVFCRSLFVLFFEHCVVCPSSIYGFWLSICYLQTLLNSKTCATSGA